jgi:TRAP-type mannitol/chloroaromatic compound transport system permease small subunit
MLKKISKILKGIDLLSEYSGKLFSFLILIIIALEVFEVVTRYVLQAPTTWSWELATLLFGAHFVIGAAWVLKENKHVRTDIFYGKFSPKVKAIVDLIFFSVIFFSFVGVLIWKSTANAIFSWKILETSFSMWGPPLYPLKTIIAFSFILLGLQGAAKWIRDLVFVIKAERI